MRVAEVVARATHVVVRASVDLQRTPGFSVRGSYETRLADPAIAGRLAGRDSDDAEARLSELVSAYGDLASGSAD
jgi:hypothetical protein